MFAPLLEKLQRHQALTTDEAATYLRLSERKLYELVANGAVPCTKVTGKWLFPKAALDRWLAAGLVAPAGLGQAAVPAIVGGSHDPLLEWALRESGCGLASLPEGSEAGLRRLARGELMAAAIHLHRLDGDDEEANVEAVAQPRQPRTHPCFISNGPIYDRQPDRILLAHAIHCVIGAAEWACRDRQLGQLWLLSPEQCAHQLRTGLDLVRMHLACHVETIALGSQ